MAKKKTKKAAKKSTVKKSTVKKSPKSSVKKPAKKAAAKKAAKKKTATASTSGSAGGERLFEFHDGKADKFWAISLDGNAHTVRYGRSGTDGQTQTKEFAATAKAKASYDKLISQKTGKGYTEVTGAATTRGSQAKADKARLKAYEPFLAAIQKDPDDVTNYGVFADWLSENGDPLGEFIHVQMELEDESLKASERKRLKSAEAKLLKEHQAEWLGELYEHLVLDVSRLERLVLTENFISDAGIASLRKTGVNLVSERQNSGRPEDDEEFLSHGDWE